MLPPPAPGERLAVPGVRHRQHLWCAGPASGPTVVVISGAGDFSLSWRQVQSRLAGTARVCTYDRSGQGWSGASRQPRIGTVIVRELHALLAAGRVRQPFVLVGHSMGGIYARMYVARYPGEVTGVVLVDPGDEHLDVAVSAATRRSLAAGLHQAAAAQRRGARACDRGDYRQDLDRLPLATMLPPADAVTDRLLLATRCRIWWTNAREGQGAPTTWAQARAAHLGAGSLGARPLAIVVSDGALPLTADPAANAELNEAWRAGQRAQRLLSSRSRFLVATGSSHLVMLDRPALVARVIQSVLRSVG